MLSQYRVLDCSDHRGHFAGFILASLGADVIDIEGADNPNRHRPPVAPHTATSLEWWALHRGRRAVTFEQLDALLPTADVLIESDAPGLNLNLDEFRRRHPQLVTVSISAFGSSGPKATWPASDLTVAAAGGAMALTGDEDRAPVRTTAPQAWLHAGGDAACGALLALEHRRHSGLGQHVDVSAQLSIMQAAIPGGLLAPNGNPSLGRIAGGIAYGPFRLQFVYPAADGHVSITLLFGDTIGPFTARLMRWVHEAGHCDTALRDLDWVGFGTALFTDPAAPARLEEAKAALTKLTRSLTKAELFIQAQQRRLLLAPVVTIGELVASEQLTARGFWETVEDPNLGPVLCPGAFARFSATQPAPLAPPPLASPPTPTPTPTPPALPSVPTLANALTPGTDPTPPNPSPVATSGLATARAAVPLTRRPDQDRTEALAGLKVVDFTWVYAGPLATRVLADYGATVVKVEGPNRPDAARGGGGALNGALDPESSVQFGSFNVNKLGVALDLTTAEGRAVVEDLARWADVLIESYTPGVMDAWNLGWERLRQINPQLIMVSTSLMGQSGPLASFAGFGNLAGAVTGFYELTGWPDRSPAGPFLAYTDYLAPRLTVPAILAALAWRRRHGVGQHIDFSQAEAAIHFLSSTILESTVNGVSRRRAGNADPHLAPHGVYASTGTDRWLAVACETDAQWSALAQVLDRGDLAGLSTAERLARQDELDQLVAGWVADRSDADGEAALIAAGVPAHRVQNSPELAADPQVAHRGHFLTVPHPVHGTMVVEAARQQLSRTPALARRAGPTLGEHTHQVLTELLAYTDEQIASLAIAGALG
ncbi:MAG: CoA transferase [Acidimicrobiales bacterium]